MNIHFVRLSPIWFLTGLGLLLANCGGGGGSGSSSNNSSLCQATDEVVFKGVAHAEADAGNNECDANVSLTYNTGDKSYTLSGYWGLRTSSGYDHQLTAMIYPGSVATDHSGTYSTNPTDFVPGATIRHIMLPGPNICKSDVGGTIIITNAGGTNGMGAAGTQISATFTVLSSSGFYCGDTTGYDGSYKATRETDLP